MISEARKERYRAAYTRAANANPMTSDTPPDWEAEAIRDSLIDEVTADIINEAADSPDEMMEMILENDYDQEGFREMCTALSHMMGAVEYNGDNRIVKLLDARVMFANAMQEFIEFKATEMATEEVDS